MTIYTDGGCSGNPGPGGWAFVATDGEKIITERTGGDKNTTNNKMELTAVIEALKYLRDETDFGTGVVRTDSLYVKNGLESWLSKWKKNGWKTSNKESVKNKDLWETLDALNDTLKITYEWVKGHSGNQFNERCDSLCKSNFN